MFKKFIDRPVLATVISIIIVILGIIGLFSLPMARFPDIAPPTVRVTGTYPGGNSETVIRSVVTPLEEQINGVEQMQYINSAAANDGTFNIRIVFKQGVDPDEAAVNVQNRVQQATPILPAEVINMGITTTKQQNSQLLVFSVYTDDRERYDQIFLQNYVNINLLPQLKRIPGVGNAQVFGIKDYSMRVWLDPTKMANYGLIPSDITNAISKQSVESAPGKLGAESDATLEYIIRYKGKKNQPEEYENIVLKSAGAEMIRLKDVARIEFGSLNYTGASYTKGGNSVTVGIFQTAGSNANEIEIGIDRELSRAAESFPPGIKYLKLNSTKEKLDDSIEQVRSTLIETFILVFIVVFLFLQDFRSTLIPAIAVPVSIIGTFFFLLVFGFTINLLTLFALVLAIAIVVDDAIVVVEAVKSKMEDEGLDGRTATHSAMGEITGAILSITMVMSAVFVPIGFMKGTSGVFYQQFAYTLAIAIVISAVNALTLTPALCALLLRHPHGEHDDEEKKVTFSKRFFKAFNASFGNMQKRYVKSITFLYRKKWLATAFVLSIIVLAGYLMTSTPKSFVPTEDDGFILFNVEMPPGTGLAKTSEVAEKIIHLLDNIEAVEANTTITGLNQFTGTSTPAYTTGYIRLKNKKDRGAVKDINEVHKIIESKLQTIKEGKALVFRVPAVQGYGLSNGADLILQDRMGRSPETLKAMAEQLITTIKKEPGVRNAYTMFRTDYPQLELEVDEEKAVQMGIDTRDLLNTIQMYFGGDQSLNFTRFGKFFRVSVKADGVFRTDEEAFNAIFARNNKNEMVPVKSMVSLKKVYGPETVTRYNLYNSLSISIIPEAGISSGAIMERMEQTVLSQLPGDYSYEWTGLSIEEKASGGQTMIILTLSILFVYFLLAAQYESYLLPLSVLFSIPTGIIGSFLAVKAVGLDNNIYVQVGLIMLVGLLAKNAILIVEFAVQRRRNGLSIFESAIEGSKARLRPIIMTSFAFIIGMIPLMFAKGSAAVGNLSISIGAAMGMLSGVVLGIFVIPILYVLFQYLQEKVSGTNKIQMTKK